MVGLSASRLTHRMTEALGAPPRAWRAWLRTQAAIGHLLREGSTLTRAAYAAGFADSAHLSRTCRRLMGVRPAMMLPRTVYISDRTEG